MQSTASFCRQCSKRRALSALWTASAKRPKRKPRALSRVIDQQYLASGSFGKIYKATVVSPWHPRVQVAIKKVPTLEDGYSIALKEARILKYLRHPNIVSILDVFNNYCESEMWIVMEFLNGGSLRPYCTGDKRMTFPEKLKVSCDCWSALAYLHNHAKVTHKDIKPENILLHRPSNQAIVAKLCDFGLAKMADSVTQTQLASVTGTAMYFPPEYVEAIRNPAKADVYSMGASLCELYSGSYFWCHPGTDVPLTYPQIIGRLLTVWKHVKRGTLAKVQDGSAIAKIDCPFRRGRIQRLLSMAVCFDRRQRPSADVMMNHFLALRKGVIRKTAQKQG